MNLDVGVADLSRGLADGTTTSRALVQACLDRIAVLDLRFGAVSASRRMPSHRPMTPTAYDVGAGHAARSTGCPCL